MQQVTFEEALEQIIVADTRYHRDSYIFVREALDHTQKESAREEREQSRSVTPVQGQTEKHVTGQQLLEGIRQCALTQFGPMAITVFHEWGIRHCRDFGNIVFNLVDFKVLRKTDTDSPADFEAGYSFDDAFRKPFLPTSKLLGETRGIISSQKPIAES